MAKYDNFYCEKCKKQTLKSYEYDDKQGRDFLNKVGLGFLALKRRIYYKCSNCDYNFQKT